jgi:aspartate dehydrogenase
MTDKRLKIGIIGCGTIGSQIAFACQGALKERVKLAALCDADAGKADELRKALKEKAPVLTMDELIGACGLVVEAASAGISAEVLSKCAQAGRDCMIMSVGGLIGHEELLSEARKIYTKVYIPSGALCGIDGLKSAASGRIDSVTLTTRKPPKGLEGAPYLKDKGMDILSITEETTVFEGSAAEAIKGFPRNVNVSAVLSIAGIGAKKTRVRIVTSPHYTKNTHEVEIEGECGKIFTRTENVPSKTNPKTSELAVFSAIATLSAITDSVRVGT